MKQKWIIPLFIIIIFTISILATIYLGLPIIIETITNNYEQKTMEKAFELDAQFPNNTKKIKDLQVGQTYSVILYEDGSVWVSGANSYYADILVYGTQVNEFTKVKIEEVEQISVGSNFVLALTKNGEVYSWGGNDYGQLGREASKIDIIPKKVPLANIKEIYTYENQAAALSNNNTAYYWGYATNSSYPDTNKIQTIKNKRITDIYLKDYQYFFKTEDDKILGLGFDFDGVTDQKNGWAREPVEFDINNVNVIRNYETQKSKSYIVKEDGTVYILDTLKGKELKKIHNTIKAKDIYSFESIRSNREDYFIIDSANNLYLNDECILENINYITKAKSNYSAQRILLLKNDGNVYTHGYSIENLIGINGYINAKEEKTLRQIDITEIKFMGITDNYIILIDIQNNIYRFGKNDHGGLGCGEKEMCEDFRLKID